MNYLTWDALKERIEKMTEQERKEPVRVWGENYAMAAKVVFDTAKEDLYVWCYGDCAYPESMIDKDRIDDYLKIVDKGTNFLIAEV